MPPRRTYKKRKTSRRRKSKKLYGGADSVAGRTGIYRKAGSGKSSAGIGPYAKRRKEEEKRLEQLAKEARQMQRLFNRISLAENRESIRPLTEAQLLQRRMEERRGRT